MICVWWFSLKVAAALTSVPVDAASESANRGLSWTQRHGDAAFDDTGTDAQRIEDGEWRNLVELPALHLAEKTLPMLSEGWGTSVGLVGAGWVVGAISWFVVLDLEHNTSTTVGWFALHLLGLHLGMIALPFALAWDPAVIDAVRERWSSASTVSAASTRSRSA